MSKRASRWEVPGLSPAMVISVLFIVSTPVPTPQIYSSDAKCHKRVWQIHPLSEKICKRLNNLNNYPFYDLGEITLQVVPERFEMFPAADDKSVWDMAPAGFSSGGFFNPGTEFPNGGFFQSRP